MLTFFAGDWQALPTRADVTVGVGVDS